MTPRTEAGRALLDTTNRLEPGGEMLAISRQFLAERILAIEAEVRTTLAAKVRALPGTGMRGSSNGTVTVWADTDRVSRREVLALIEGSDPASPEPMPDGACGAMGLCELPKGHGGKHSTSVDRAIEASPAPATEPRSLSEPLDELARKAEEYIEVVVTYLDPANQFTHSRRRHVDRTGEELAELVAARLATDPSAPEQTDE